MSAQPTQQSAQDVDRRALTNRRGHPISDR
jgi:hypothetical protein